MGSGMVCGGDEIRVRCCGVLVEFGLCLSQKNVHFIVTVVCDGRL